MLAYNGAHNFLNQSNKKANRVKKIFHFDENDLGWADDKPEDQVEHSKNYLTCVEVKLNFKSAF